MESRSSNIFYSDLNLLSADNRSGSKELLSKLNKLIIRDLDYIDLNNNFFQNLSDSFRSFEAIQKYLTELQNFSDNNSKDKIKIYLEHIEEHSEEVYDKIYTNLKRRINGKVSIITLSNSQTVLEILKRLNIDKLLTSLIICESRPQNEGRDLAATISAIDIKTEIILDSRIPEYTAKTDLGLIGADIILDNGNVVNKIGSKSLAICCKYYSKPFYVLGDSNKFSNKGEFSQTKRSPHEIWENHPEKIEINNYYFEEIRSNLITEILTEE